jgi:hypothetical protein
MVSDTMRKKREFMEGAFYHVTSRTNDKTRIFENRLGRKIMLIALLVYALCPTETSARRSALVSVKTNLLGFWWLLDKIV